METSVFRVSEERPGPGLGGTDCVWAWLRRHRRVVLWGVVLALAMEGLMDLYEVAMQWVAGNRDSALDDLLGVPMYFFAAWGVYRRPAVWGRRVGMLLVWVGAGVLGIGVPIVWWFWRTHPEAKGWWDTVSMSGRDWLGVALHVAGLIVFTAACLALRRLYPEAPTASGYAVEK